MKILQALCGVIYKQTNLVQLNNSIQFTTTMNIEQKINLLIYVCVAKLHQKSK